MSDPRIVNLVNGRDSSHGNFKRASNLAIGILNALTSREGWYELNAEHQYALIMIAVKMARILEGNPLLVDHWDDIAGYATLVAQGLIDDEVRAGGKATG
jgi:hypothetical protein